MSEMSGKVLGEALAFLAKLVIGMAIVIVVLIIAVIWLIVKVT